jgi:hypothetical protein
VSGRTAIAWLVLAVAAAGATQALAADRSPRTYALPPGTLRLSDTRLQASSGEHVTFTVTLTRRAVSSGSLELTLPRQWIGRSGVSGLPYASAPTKGSPSSGRAKVSRSGRAVRFVFSGARRDDAARYTITDKGIPARTYSLPFVWRERGRSSTHGTATVTVFAVQRTPR